MYDVMIIGGGAAGISCALILGSARTKPFAADKKIGIIMHQRASALTNALINNVLGVAPGTRGKEILENGKKHLAETYPHVRQIEKEKVTAISGEKGNFTITTNKNTYQAATIVVAVGASGLFNIEGLNQYVAPHPNIPPEKEKIWLKNTDHGITDGIYVAGTLAGFISQLPIASGSGALVATYILKEWNGGKPVAVHDVNL